MSTIKGTMSKVAAFSRRLLAEFQENLRRADIRLGIAMLLAGAGCTGAFGQQQVGAGLQAGSMRQTSVGAAAYPDSDLPNSPDVVMAAADTGWTDAGGNILAAESTSVPDGNSAANGKPAAGPKVAPKSTKYIPAGYQAQPINAHDKLVLGARDLISPFSFIGIVFTAGYSQVLNGEPNYGTDKGAFGQRLGATAIRDSSEGIFTDAVFAPVLREDPRYYLQGPGHSFIHRLVYAGTRPILTRTDGGKSTVNGALLLGYAAASALSYTYYPKSNQNFHDTASTFGGGLGGAAFGYVVSEFSGDFLQALHLQKKP